MRIKIICTIFIAILTATGYPSMSQTDSIPKVMLMKIQSDIDPRSNRYTELALDYAEEIDADYVLIEMDTYGGALNDADDIRTRVLNYEKPIYVYINKDAASAGALISIACDSIYMASGASIGAATVVTADGTAAPDKYQSYMRSIMRSTAEAKGRDPQIAEAMVDENIEVEGISEDGKVITFSTSEAIKYGFCEAEVSGFDDIMERSGVKDYELVEYEISTAEKIIAFFLNPFISGILVLVIIGGLYFELQTPGVGFPILASLIALILYLTPYYLNGLAENWEIALFFVGIALIAVEVFVIPGFGVAGILGIACSVGALILVMLNNDAFDFSFVGFDQILFAAAAIFAALLGAGILMFVAGAQLAGSKFFSRIALAETMEKTEGYTSNFKKESFVGKRGTAHTVLRPSGKVLIDGDVYDAFARGNYIEQGAEIEVIAEEGTSLKVKEVA